jgi:outer membrane protein assembly factor BamD (BamD/ComL family)
MLGSDCLSRPARADWPRIFGGSQAEPGTAEWWKSNKSKAVHEVGKGYKVPGVEGYFDGMGRPIDTPVSSVARRLGEAGESKGIAPWLDPKPALSRAKTAMGMGPNEARAREAIAQAEAALVAREFAAAEKLFREAVNRAPDTGIEQQALFGLGESRFFRNEYYSAIDDYGKLLEKYPNTPRFDDVIERIWAIGQYWDAHHQRDKAWAIQPNLFDETRPTFDTAGNAIKAYEAIRLNDPTGPRADDAIMATANIYFRRSQYQDADYHYTLLRQEYPRSEYQFEAHLLGLQSKLRKYQGPDYDGKPLEEAKKLAKQIQTQFSGRLSTDERERLQKTQADVVRMIAERDLRMATYYDDTDHNLAARYYYSQVARDYSQTGVGKEAERRMVAIADQPDVPTERLGWFVEMFPENAERARVARIPELGGSGTLVADERGNSNVQQAGAQQPTTINR